MLNQIVLVGRLIENPEMTDVNDRKECKIEIAVPRSYKNEKGEYDTDFIPIVVWNGIAENLVEYCHKGDLIGIKGRVEANDGQIILVGERITFLSSKKEEE